MATDNFESCLAFTWRPENDGQPLHTTAGDRGGATSWGVTLATYSAWRAAHGIQVTTVDDLAAASQSELSQLIRSCYWGTVHGDQLPIGVDLMCFDFGFTAGSGTAIRLLQCVLDVAVDGDLGPQTMRAAGACRPRDLIQQLQSAQLSHYRSLADFGRFGRGWSARTGVRSIEALLMRAASQRPVTAPAATAPAANTNTGGFLAGLAAEVCDAL